MTAITDAQTQLRDLLERIFEDDRADASERHELRDLISSGALTMAQVKNAFEAFANHAWATATADGQLSSLEIQRLSQILSALKLDRDSLPLEWATRLKPIEWELLQEFSERTQAEVLGELLSQEGIATSVEGAFAAGLLPGVTKVRVMVPREAIEDAKRVAEAFHIAPQQ